ncbi:MAG: hypothetical protein WCL27_01900 [Betaproteobacteria bacterium]
MKLDAKDLPKLQISLVAAILMIALGAATVHFALKSIKSTKLDRATAQSERNDFDGKLKRVRNEENEIKEKSATFSRLQARGVIGEEQRLEWVELLKEIREKRRLIDLEYEILPQRSLDTNPGSGFAFFTSSMKMQLKLLHEEDLTRFIDDLRQQAKALVQIRSCHVSRLPRSSGEIGMPAQLLADCQIDLLTLREVSLK